MLESEYEFDNVDDKELAKYLKIVVSKEELAPDRVKRKLMLSLLFRELVRVIMTNHLYTFGGKLYRQAAGGPIGLQFSSTAARAVLRLFDREYRKKLHELQLQLLLDKRYVDDKNMAARAVPAGKDVVVGRDGKLELVELEIPGEDEADAHTAKVYRKVADTIRPKSIKMTEDFPSKYSSGDMPILDMKVRMKDGFIEHRHYTKPMASKSVIQASSAFTAAEKMNILVNEGNRRLKNYSPHLSWEEKKRDLTTLMIQMEEGGHKESFRAVVAVRTVARYQNSLKNHQWGKKRMYRSREEQKQELEAAGGRASKSNWFQRSGATNLLRVPATTDSSLAKAVEGALARTAAPSGLRAKVVEEPGRSVGSWLVKSNPFPRKSCGRRLCPWLARGEDCQERCYAEGVTYLARCKRCRERQIREGVEEGQVEDQGYIGESHRSIVTRCGTHYNLYKPGNVGARGGAGGGGEQEGGLDGDELKAGSWMKEHTLTFHQGVFSENKMDDYEFIVLNQHRKVLRRQLEEAIFLDWAQSRGVIKLGKRVFRINRNVLNSKFEHWRPRPVFIVGR